MLLLLEEQEIQNKSIGRADNKWFKVLNLYFKL